MVIGIGPKAGEFKAIAGFFFFGFAAFGVLDGVKAGAEVAALPMESSGTVDVMI